MRFHEPTIDELVDMIAMPRAELAACLKTTPEKLEPFLDNLKPPPYMLVFCLECLAGLHGSRVRTRLMAKDGVVYCH